MRRGTRPWSEDDKKASQIINALAELLPLLGIDTRSIVVKPYPGRMQRAQRLGPAERLIMSGRGNPLQWPCGSVRALFPRLDKTPKLKYLLRARPFSPYKSAAFKKCPKKNKKKNTQVENYQKDKLSLLVGKCNWSHGYNQTCYYSNDELIEK